MLQYLTIHCFKSAVPSFALILARKIVWIYRRSHPLCRDPTEDHVLLHPCFRYAEVKQALTHITLKLGLVEQPGTNTPYVFLYMASNRYLYIMVSPFRYEDDRLCYGFQYVMRGPAYRNA